LSKYWFLRQKRFYLKSLFQKLELFLRCVVNILKKPRPIIPYLFKLIRHECFRLESLQVDLNTPSCRHICNASNSWLRRKGRWPFSNKFRCWTYLTYIRKFSFEKRRSRNIKKLVINNFVFNVNWRSKMWHSAWSTFHRIFTLFALTWSTWKYFNLRKQKLKFNKKFILRSIKNSLNDIFHVFVITLFIDFYVKRF